MTAQARWPVRNSSGFEGECVIPILGTLEGIGDGSAVIFEADERLAGLSERWPMRMAGRGGRPPLDPAMMFKVLAIQTINALSDERTEYLVNDRPSFMRLPGLGPSGHGPDARAIRLFRQRWTSAGEVEALFARFDAMLGEAGHIPMPGGSLTHLSWRLCIGATRARDPIKEGGGGTKSPPSYTGHAQIISRPALKPGSSIRPADFSGEGRGMAHRAR